LNTDVIIPKEYTDALAISSSFISGIEICKLSHNFHLWQKEIFSHENITTLVANRAIFVDQILTKLWCQHNLDEFQISLIAVGGYGRAELHPFSDVDILLLTQEEINKDLEEKISALSRSCGT